MVRLNGKRLLRHHRRVNGIIDITRIRLDQWLRDMDAPNKGIRLFSDGRSIATSGPRTYRIHVSVHLSGDDEQRETTRHWTVVMDRTGVRRIEPVA